MSNKTKNYQISITILMCIAVLFLLPLFNFNNTIEFSMIQFPSNAENKFHTSRELGYEIIIEVGGYPYSIDIGDANNDEIKDIAVANYLDFHSSLLSWNQTVIDWEIQALGNWLDGPTDIVIEDVNNDGFNDITMSHVTNDISILLWNESLGNWSETLTVYAGGFSYGLDVGDVNNDLFNDIVVSNYYAASISIFCWNEGVGDWDPLISKDLMNSPRGVCIGDVNNDGRNEIIVTNEANASISIFCWNEELSNWDSPVVKSVGLTPIGACIADANNDGIKDIIVANYGDNTISILYWNEDLNEWSLLLDMDVGVNPRGVDVEDINNDGYNDIVTANEAEDTISVIYWNPTSMGWGSQIRKNVGDSPRGVRIGDVNNDGVNDIVVANKNDDTLSIFLGQESSAPTWDQVPANQWVPLGKPFCYNINASDPSDIDRYWLTGTSSFTIDNNGVITNTSVLTIGVYPFTINVNDTYGNTESIQIKVTVIEMNKLVTDIIEEIIDSYLDEYTENGYFPSTYEPSLQGIYFVLSILNNLDALDSINQSEITEIIMEYYDSDVGMFVDEYAQRYLDTDFELEYYPLSTLLEVNCYAILSLEILGQLNQIDTQEILDFIWSCYDSNTGGFIGQLYDTNLHEYFKTSTLDNTYYAVKALDALLENWQGYSTQKTQIIEFIQDLQVLDPSYDFYGGFNNEANEDFLSIIAYGPNMLSSYYAIKSLEIFGVENSINIDLFYHFLSSGYHQNGDYFDYSDYNIYLNYSIFAATAMGLDLSVLMGYTEINETEIMNFLLNSRNELDIWDSTTSYGFYELIDTFQIIRSLSEANKISELNTEDKDNIVDAMEMFESYRGYSFTSKEYMRADLIFSIIQSCSLFDCVSDLELQELYLYFREAYFEMQVKDWKGFYGYTNIDGDYGLLRLFPIEFYNEGIHNFSKYVDYHNNHKFTYKALTSLEKIYKLDDFITDHNVSELIESIENCQITEGSSGYFGAFVPFEYWRAKPLDRQEKMITFEQTYFAIKNLAYLMETLELGNISNTNVDLDAVYTYLFKHIEETPQILYYDPEYTNNPETLLKNTYYLIDLLTIIDQYSLNTEKIKNFVLQTVNYSNIESVYYSYKIDEALNLGFQFDLDQTHLLVHTIYDENKHEFYLTPEHITISYEILYWLSYMAVNDEYRCTIDYDTIVQLNGENHINASICNIVLEGLSPYATLRLESKQLGTHTFDETGMGTYEYIATIPLDPANYPIVYANVCLYETSQKIKEYPISFSTEYTFDFSYSVSNSTDTRDVSIYAYLSTATGNVALYEGSAYVDVYRDGKFIQRKYLAMQNFAHHTEFMETIHYDLFGEYSFELYVNDGLNGTAHYIGTYSFSYKSLQNPNFPFIPSADSNYRKEGTLLSTYSTILFPIFIISIALPLGIIIYTTYLKKKRS